MRSSRNFNRREREGRRERGRENFDASQMLRPNDSVKVGEGERKEGGGCTVLLEGERERQFFVAASSARRAAKPKQTDQLDILSGFKRFNQLIQLTFLGHIQ